MSFQGSVLLFVSINHLSSFGGSPDRGGDSQYQKLISNAKNFDIRHFALMPFFISISEEFYA